MTPSDAVPKGATAPRSGVRAFLAYALGFLVVAALALLPVTLEGNWSTFFDHTFAFQRDRGSPFSIWGLWGGLDTLQTAVQLAAVAFALSLLVIWRRRTLVQTAALGAVVLIALQLSLTYWFYLYVVWFFPLVIIALLGRFDDPAARAAAPPPAQRKPAGAGTSSCSIPSARSGELARTSTPISHGSSSEGSKRTGICVTSDSIACSFLTPITPPRAPVMPTSVM